jgi:hypothetical protein
MPNVTARVMASKAPPTILTGSLSNLLQSLVFSGSAVRGASASPGALLSSAHSGRCTPSARACPDVVLTLSRVADQTPADPDLQGAQSGADRWAVGLRPIQMKNPGALEGALGCSTNELVKQ